MEITTIGLDLAKRVFQVHGVDAAGGIVVRKAVRRAQVLSFFAKLPACLVGIEACGTSHHWARELMRLGHRVRLMPPAYVKPYDELEVMQSYLPKGRIYCAPADVRVGEVRDAIVTYLANNPADRAKAAATLATLALVRSFACTK